MVTLTLINSRFAIAQDSKQSLVLPIPLRPVVNTGINMPDLTIFVSSLT